MSFARAGFKECPPSARLLQALLAEVTGSSSLGPEVLATMVGGDASLRSALRQAVVHGGAFHERNRSLRELTLLWGMERVVQVVADSLFAELVNDEPLNAYGLRVDAFYARALATAIWTRALAEMQHADPTRAYAIGMLHEIGMIALNRLVLKVKPHLRIPLNPVHLQVQTERREVRADFLQVGQQTLEDWAFPAVCANAIRFQQHPLLHTGSRRYSMLLHLGRLLGRAQLENGPRAAVDTLPANVLIELELRPQSILTELPKVEEGFVRRLYAASVDSVLA
ncbi:MAG: HDOD domain-containing protein [Opitutales bacterium]|nr:HDOD domain-containing protein [Opitutales bacterium]